MAKNKIKSNRCMVGRDEKERITFIECTTDGKKVSQEKSLRLAKKMRMIK